MLHAQPRIPFPGPRRALGARLSSSPSSPSWERSPAALAPSPGSILGLGGHGCCFQGLSVLGGDRQQGACWRRGRAWTQRELAVGPPGVGDGGPVGKGTPVTVLPLMAPPSPPECRGSRDREVSTAAEGCRDAQDSMDRR